MLVVRHIFPRLFLQVRSKTVGTRRGRAALQPAREPPRPGKGSGPFAVPALPAKARARKARPTPAAPAALQVTLAASPAAQGTRLQRRAGSGTGGAEGDPARPRGGGSAPPLPAPSNGPPGYTLTAPRGSRFPGGWSCGEGRSGT